MTPSRILVRLPNWVGDVLMARPALEALRVRFPAARLMGVTRPALHPLVERFDLFERLVPAPAGTGAGRVWRMRAVVRDLRRWGPDVAVVMAPSFEAALTVRLARVPMRVGHDTDRRRWLLTDPVRLRDAVHRSEAFGDLARVLGAHPPASPGPLALTPSDRRYADRLFEAMAWEAAPPPIFLNPAAAKTPRAWSAERFCRTAERLSGLRPVVVHARPPFRAPPAWGRRHCIALVDDATLPELAALLARCALYVGNDSGPAHLAAAVGTATVTIYGSSVPSRTGPRAAAARAPADGTETDGAGHRAVSASFACAPCRERFFTECPSPPTHDGRPPCLDAVSVEMVAAAVERALAMLTAASP